MDISRLPETVKVLFYLFCVFVCFQVYLQLTVGRRRRALCREKGVLPVPWMPGLKDRLLGLDLFLENIKIRKDHRILENAVNRFRKAGFNTMRLVMLGQSVYLTVS